MEFGKVQGCGLWLRRAGRASACGSRGNGSRRESRRDCGEAGAAWRGRGGETELTGGPSLSAKARALAGGPGCGSGAPCASSWAERATLAGGTGRSGRKTRGWAGLSGALVGRVCAGGGGESGPKRDWCGLGQRIGLLGWFFWVPFLSTQNYLNSNEFEFKLLFKQTKQNHAPA